MVSWGVSLWGVLCCMTCVASTIMSSVIIARVKSIISLRRADLPMVLCQVCTTTEKDYVYGHGYQVIRGKLLSD
jgi:hypothetical protein